MYSSVLTKNEQVVQPFENLVLRQACEDDVEFIIEAIIESEKSGRQLIGTCEIFGITEDDYKNILREVLLEDAGDYEYSLRGFLIAESNGEYMGTSGSWIECFDDLSSGIMKSSIFTSYLSKENVIKLEKNLDVIDSLSIPREPYTYQLEHVYIKNKFRKLGLFSILIKENIKRNRIRYPFSKVQTILFKENAVSYYAHLKFGFEVVDIKVSQNLNIYKYFPYNSKVLMELNNEKIQTL